MRFVRKEMCTTVNVKPFARFNHKTHSHAEASRFTPFALFISFQYVRNCVTAKQQQCKCKQRKTLTQTLFHSVDLKLIRMSYVTAYAVGNNKYAKQLNKQLTSSRKLIAHLYTFTFTARSNCKTHTVFIVDYHRHMKNR